MSLPERSAGFLMATMLHLETELQNNGVSKEIAAKISQSTVDNLRKSYGGEHIYFPKGKELDAILKHHEIYKHWNGHNQVQLAKEFNMTVPAVYRILKKAQDKQTDKSQTKLAF
jgi:Mor family transcriptional regulator